MERKKTLFRAVNYIVLALGILGCVYVMANGIGLADSLDFGAGAYYYADIPEFAKYTDRESYVSPVSMGSLLLLFLIWGVLMYKAWVWIEKKK